MLHNVQLSNWKSLFLHVDKYAHSSIAISTTLADC